MNRRLQCLSCGEWFTPPKPSLFSERNPHLCDKCQSDDAPKVEAGEEKEKHE